MPTLRMLGQVRLEADDGAEIEDLQRQPKRLALLAYLASPRAGTWHRRDTLLGVFWPELDSNRGRTALRSALYALRQQLGAEVVRSRGENEVSLDPERFRTDTAILEACEDPADALAQYRGEFLPGFFIADAEGFEKWLDGERGRLKGLALRAARQLVDQAERSGDWAAASAAGLKALDLEPEDESLLRRVIGVLDRSGDRAQALAVYQRFRERLAAEYEAEPSEETARLVRDLQGRRAAPASTPVPPPADPAAVPTGERGPAPPAPQPAPATVRPRRGLLRLGVVVVAAALLGVALLRDRGSPAAEPARSLLVFTLENQAGPSFDYVATGLSDDFARRLRGFGGLRTARTSSAAVEAAQLREVGAAFGSSLAVRGTLTRAGDSLRVTTDIVDLASGDRQPTGTVTFATSEMQDAGGRIAAAVAGAIFRRGVPARSPAAAPRVDPESYRLAMEGWHHQTRSDFGRARDLFTRASELDPANAHAWSGLAAAWGALAVSYRVPWEEGFERANAAAARALALDSLQAPALANFGLYRALVSRSLAEGELLIARAIAMDPGNSGTYLTQHALYRHAWAWDQARDGIRVAQQMDPLNPYFVDREALLELCAGRPNDALRAYRRELAMDSTRRDAALGVARSLAWVGRWDESLEELRGFATRTRDTTLVRALSGARGETGYWQVMEADGRRRLAALREAGTRGWVSPSQLAMVTVAAGELEEGLRMLEAQAEADEVGLYRLPCFAEVDRIRGEPRFQALLKKLSAGRTAAGEGQREERQRE